LLGSRHSMATGLLVAHGCKGAQAQGPACLSAALCKIIWQTGDIIRLCAGAERTLCQIDSRGIHWWLIIYAIAYS
jgi:hypothetical protein